MKKSLSFPPQPASPLIRSTVNLLRDKVKWNRSSHAGVGTGRNFQFPSVQFLLHFRATAGQLRRAPSAPRCTLAILFINATNPRLRVSRVCAARRRAHAIFPPALAPWTSAQNILTGWPRWTSVNRPSSLGRETILSTAFRIPACAPLIFPRDFFVSFDGNIVSWLFFLLLFFFFWLLGNFCYLKRCEYL